MSKHLDFYRERAAEARRDADATTLENVRDKCLRSAAAWDLMATRSERTQRMRADLARRKAAAAANAVG